MTRFVLLLLLAAGLGTAQAGGRSTVTFASFAGARDMSPSELARHVDVRRIELTLPADSAGACSKTLWDTFANTDHEMSFNPVQLTHKNQGKYWRSLTQAMVDSAEAKGLPAEALGRCLSSLGRHGGARLLVAAYLAQFDGSPVWIVIEKWEYEEDGRPTEAHHIHLRAFRVEDNRLVCEIKCT